MLHFSNKGRTIHLLFRNDEFRIVAKSHLFHPDTLIAKIHFKDLCLLKLAEKSLRIKCLPIDLQHSQAVEHLHFSLPERKLMLEFDSKEEVFEFSEQEWRDIIQFASLSE